MVTKMYRNVYYDSRKSKIHIWETFKGENLYDTFAWVPYCYEYNDDGSVKTIDGRKAKKITFDNYFEYHKYQEVHNQCLENRVKPEIQFLAERYHTITDDVEAPKLRIYSIDIETHGDVGFSGPEEAAHPITCVSIHDLLDNKTYTFGRHAYTGKYNGEPWFEYKHCTNEEQLLNSVFNFFQKKPPDVITGWSILAETQSYMGFDIPYLINRCKKLFGEDTDLYRKFSPIGVVRTWKPKLSEGMAIDIAGLTILDYIDLYKWYSPNKLENYTLDNVCKTELDKGKVDYSEYNDLKELYTKDWNKYVEYNVIDALRVGQLEEDLGYIKLVQTLAILCKSPMKFYNSMTALIEGLMLTYYRQKGMCASRMFGGTQETFEAAFVKEPHVGRYDWVIDLDIVSSYPTAIITLNMSPETYYGRIKDLTEDEVIHYTREQEFPEITLITMSGTKSLSGVSLVTFNNGLKKRLLSVAPCGSVFLTSKEGVLVNVMKMLFAKRGKVKKDMIKIKKSLSELRGDNLIKAKERRDRYNAYQQALKIMLNAIFGATSVPYSRYFNKNIAEAIVSCGRHTRAQGEKYANELLNKPNDDILTVLNMIKDDLKNGK